jgi:hypothetical protein
MLCLNCNKRPAQRIEPFGFTYCKVCIKKQRQLELGETIEITTEEIRESRKEFKEDIYQPYRGGKVSKNYIKKYGTKNIDATEQEVREAMNKPDIWDNSYYKE